MPISTTDPSPENDRLREELLSPRSALFIGAHPDDIEFYCGCLVRMMRGRGTRVTFAIATRGGRGRSGKARVRLEDLRTRYQLDAARILEVDDVVFFDYPDKYLADHAEPLSADLKSLLARANPEIVLGWDPDFIYNPHPDHQAAASAARIASEGFRTCWFGTREPNVWSGCEGNDLRSKLAALRAHRTETPWCYWPIARTILLRKMAGEGTKIRERYAEVFRFPDPE